MIPLKERILQRVFRISRYYAWWVLIITILLTGASVYYIRDIPIRGSFLDLLPRNDPLVDEYRRIEELLRTDFLVLLLSLQEGEGLPIGEREDRLLRAAGEITRVLAKNPEFIEVSYLAELSPEIPDQFVLLYRLNEEELAHIESSLALARRSLGDEQVAYRGLALLPATDLADAYQRMSEAFDAALRRGMAAERNGEVAALEDGLFGVKALNSTVLSAIAGIDEMPEVTAAVEDLSMLFAPTEEAIVRVPEAFFSDDRTRLLITVKPRFSAQLGVAYSTAVMETLNADLARIDLDRLQVTVGVTGTYAFAAEMNAVINADMLRTTIISSVGVLVIFFLAFGSIFYSFIAVVPLLVSVVLTMAWAKFAVDGFNLMTTFLPALVLGLGIDYGIHLISRYSEERRKGSSLNQALHTAIFRKGTASAVAALTTSLVFFGLLFSRSRALFEMGAITGMGVIISFLATLFLLPALITITHFLFRSRRREGVINHVPRLASYFREVTAKGRAIFVIILILTFFIAFQASQTRFVFSSRDMIPRMENTKVLNEVLTHFGEEGPPVGNYFTFFASSEEELARVVGHLQTSDLVDRDRIESAWALLPVNLAEQQQVLRGLDIGAYIEQLAVLDRSLADRSDVLAQIRTLLTQFSLLQYVAALHGEVGIASTGSALKRQLRDIQGLLQELDIERARGHILGLSNTLSAFEQDLAQARDLPPVEELLRDIIDSFPKGLAARFITPGGDYIIQARMLPEIFDEGNLQYFANFAASFSDNYFGMPLVAKQLEEHMERDFLISTILAAVLIILTLWRAFGGVIRALLAAAPLILGYVWMLGGMRLLQIDFNFVNIAISPLLIGIGVDNGIHILHRYREERSIDPEGAIERGGKVTAVAVIVTSLTTMLVFGSLLLARTPGLRLLGISALLGIGFTLLFSLLFLPAALRVAGAKRV